MSCIRALGSKTSYIFQGLSCLWRHNDARIIISLAWFYNLFLWDLCHFRAIGSTDCSEVIHSTNSPRANSYFLSLIFEVLHALGVVIWLHDSCCFLGTTIHAEKHQQLEFMIFIPSFSHLRICGSNWKIFFLIRGENLNFLCFSSI